jgi:hypothetical protein
MHGWQRMWSMGDVHQCWPIHFVKAPIVSIPVSLKTVLICIVFQISSQAASPRRPPLIYQKMLAFCCGGMHRYLVSGEVRRDPAGNWLDPSICALFYFLVLVSMHESMKPAVANLGTLYLLGRSCGGTLISSLLYVCLRPRSCSTREKD